MIERATRKMFQKSFHLFIYWFLFGYFSGAMHAIVQTCRRRMARLNVFDRPISCCRCNIEIIGVGHRLGLFFFSLEFARRVVLCQFHFFRFVLSTVTQFVHFFATDVSCYLVSNRKHNERSKNITIYAATQSNAKFFSSCKREFLWRCEAKEMVSFSVHMFRVRRRHRQIHSSFAKR